jgi:hypothetical protein
VQSADNNASPASDSGSNTARAARTRQVVHCIEHKFVDEFGYLSVIISVILGLSIAQLLQGMSQVINARDRVRIYWPSMAWTILLLLVDIQAWWAMFGYRNLHIRPIHRCSA